jgi:Trypsin-like peptidase domain
VAITARRSLWVFLTERFAETGTLVRFVDHYFSQLRRELNLETSLGGQADSLIAVLIDHGLVDQIWDALRTEREQFTGEIDEMAKLWQRDGPLTGDATGSAPGAEPPPAAAPPAEQNGRMWLKRETVLDVHRAAALAGLEDARPALLLDVPEAAIAEVAHVPSPRAQMLMDVHHLSRGVHGVDPIRAWIANARSIAPDGVDTTPFTAALESLDAASDADAEAVRLAEGHFDGLEAIILSNARPILVAHGDTFVLNALDPFADELGAGRAFVEQALRATGKLKVRNHPTVDWTANVFVVGDDLVCTARHALLESDDPNQPMEYSVDFDDEQRTVGWPRELQVSEVALRCESFDVSFLRVPDLKGMGIEPLTLARAAPSPGDALARITFVARDPRVDLQLQERVLGGYELKRVMAGRVMKLDDDRPGARLMYDTNTLAGVSGSPIVSLGTGEVLGVGTMRIYLKGNWAVPAWELLADPHVLELDARFRR